MFLWVPAAARILTRELQCKCNRASCIHVPSSSLVQSAPPLPLRSLYHCTIRVSLCHRQTHTWRRRAFSSPKAALMLAPLLVKNAQQSCCTLAVADLKKKKKPPVCFGKEVEGKSGRSLWVDKHLRPPFPSLWHSIFPCWKHFLGHDYESQEQGTSGLRTGNEE